MIEIKAKTGLVGFFDIMGYSQMLRANDVESTARIVVEVLAEVPNNVIAGVLEDQGLERIEGLKTQKQFEDIWRSLVHDQIDWLLFSDSILVSIPVDTEEDITFWGIRVIAFLQVCAFLQRQMVNSGLPLRGGISFGEFFIQDSYFSGKPIIDAYQHAESLNLAGCLLGSSVEQLYNEMKKHARAAGYEDSISSMLEQLCIRYSVPKKRDRVESGLMLNWINLPLRFFEGLPGDIRDYVYSSFVAHNKDVVPAVQSKIENTEAFVRKVIRNVVPKPWPVVTRQLDKALQEMLGE